MCTGSASWRRSGVEKGAELPGDHVGVGGELAPGDPDDAVAGDLKRPVPCAVTLERLPRAVRREAVAVDDEAFRVPRRVELAVIAVAVDLRAREVVGIDEGEEAALEDASRDARAILAVVLEDASDRCGPSAPRVAPDESIEGRRAS